MDWADVTLETMERFCHACGVSFVRIRRDGPEMHRKVFLVLPNRAYMRQLARGEIRDPFRHLSEQQRANFLKRCEEWATLQAKASPENHLTKSCQSGQQ
jgi:hypothetical protein